MSAKELQDQKNRERQAQKAKERRKLLTVKAAANDRSQSLRASQDEKLKRFR